MQHRDFPLLHRITRRSAIALTGIFVNTRTIQDDPDVIRHFIAATVKGADDFAKDPKAGVDAVMAAAPYPLLGTATPFTR